jgi:adenylate cyclase
MTKQQHQLAAIMFTDIQGYTAMMQHNEAKAIEIRQKHRKVFTTTTEKFNGKILQYFGDGTLSIFNSSIDAVRCAMEMQMAFQKELVVPVRIGIHSGDIIYNDEEIIGDGVNIAARIEALAVPGSVFISDKIYDEIKNQSDIQTKSLQKFELKNVDQPLEIFVISNEGLTVPKIDDIKGYSSGVVDESGQKLPNQHANLVSRKKNWVMYSIIVLAILVITYYAYQNAALNQVNISKLDKSIAVLAFKNMSADPLQEYFSDGISEEILNALAKITELKVAGRTSSFSFKNKETDIRTIGDKLGVSMILEGSVRKSEDKLRITVQLINVADGYHIWSEQYDREMKDIFAIQEEIANNIVTKLQLTVLKPEDVAPIQPTNSIEAYDLYLKGLYAMARDVEGVSDALIYFEQAIELDPEFALAYAGKGDAYLSSSSFGLIPIDKALLEARKATKKSILLDPTQAEGHKLLAYIHLFYDWDWESAKSEYEQAIELGYPSPNKFITWYEALLYQNYKQAIIDAQGILDRDPLSVDARWQLGLCYYLGEEYYKAIESFETCLELNPDHSEAYRGIGISYRQLAMYEESEQALEKAMQISQGRGPAAMDMLTVLGASGQKEKLRGTLDYLHELNKQQNVPPIVFALGYAYLGDMDEAFKWLDATYNERFLWLLSIKSAPEWDVFRSDPRFDELVVRMNFPES